MRILLKDFLTRHALILFAIAAAMAVFPFMGIMGVCLSTFWMLPGLGMMLGEQAAGATRVITALPTSRQIRGRIAWVQAVIMFPLLYACVLYPILGLLVWFGYWDTQTLVLQLAAPLLGMGILAIAFLLLPWMWPTPGILWEQVRAFTVLGGYFLFLACFNFALLFRAKETEWLYALLAGKQRVITDLPIFPRLALCVFIAIAAAILSFRFSQRIFDSLPLHPKRSLTKPSARKSALPPRALGLLRPWGTMVFRAAMFTVIIATVLTFPVRISPMADTPTPEAQATLFTQLLVMTFAAVVSLLSQCTVWAGTVRSLRMLPMTRARLTGVLLSFYLVCLAVAVTGIFLLACHWGLDAPLQTTITYATCLLAWGFLCLALLIRFGGMGTFLLLLILWSITSFYLVAIANHPDWFLAVQPAPLLVSLASAFWLYRILGHSSAAYRRKPLLEEGKFHRF